MPLPRLDRCELTPSLCANVMSGLSSRLQGMSAPGGVMLQSTIVEIAAHAVKGAYGATCRSLTPDCPMDC